MQKSAVGIGWLQTARLQKRLPCTVNLVLFFSLPPSLSHV